MAAVGEPVGPVVFLGSTAVGADDEVAMVAPKSDSFSFAAGGGGTAADLLAIVALGSKGLSPATNKPPSIVQNF